MKKTIPFYLKLIVLFLVLMLIGAILLTVVFFKLKDYELKNPTGIINQYITLLKTEKYKEAMELSGVEEEKFFNSEDYGNYIKDILGDIDKANTVEVYSKDENKRIFRLYGNDVNSYILLDLTPDENGSYKLSQEEVKKQTFTITAPNNFILKVNDVELSEDEIVKKDVIYEGYDGVADKNIVPKKTEYTIEGYFKNHKITVKDKNIEDLSIIYNENKIDIGYAVKDKESLEDIAVDVAQSYAKYISKDESESKLRAKLIKDTEFYNNLSNYSSYWYIDHDKVSFENLECTDTAVYSDNAYMTVVSFDYVVTKGRIVNTYPVKYLMYLLKENGTYKVANIKSI